VCGDGIVETPPETCDDGNVVAGDGCSATCQVENRAPVCDTATPSVAALWPPNHKFAALTVEGVTDPDGDPVAITVTAIAQDEPLAGAGDGNTCPDATGVGTASANVRAERSGQGDGRVYHIAFSADDGHGASCTGNVMVCVRHDNGRGSVCTDQGPLVDATGMDPDACNNTCHPETCAPEDRELDPISCGDEALPARAAKRVKRARLLLARSAEHAGSRKARRLGRRAATHLRAAATIATRAGERGHISEPCAAALSTALTQAAGCAACEPADD
jgi:cysteine-rich repeat protein